VYCYNVHNNSITHFTDCNFDDITVFNNKVIAIKSDGIYEMGNYTETNNIIDTTIGSINLKKKCYTSDCVLTRNPDNPMSMYIENKEGVGVSYTFNTNENKINLAKGHTSRYFSINLNSPDVAEIKELKLIVEEVATIE